MTITELQEIALRQQQQIDINHQLLLAREKRLNILKLEEARNQQLTLLTNSLSSAALNSNSNSSQFQQVTSNGKQNALSQELKIFKLKQLRSQLLDSKLSNSNMCSELDLIKTLFKDKEKDLTWAMNKVEELKRQIEQLGGLRASNRVGPTSNKVHPPPNTHVSSSTSNITELERLKQELQIRNKLNEQQSKKIQQQQDLFNRKQLELIELDKRIDELKTRIRNKRHRLQSHHQQHQLNHEALEREIAVKNMQMTMNETGAQSDVSYHAAQNAANKSSPSKAVAKFASKQEIANTYMNRTEAFQKYRMMQNNTPQFNQSPSNMMMVYSPSQPAEEIENSSTSSASMNNNPSNVVNNPASSTSSLGSLSSPVPQNSKQGADAANSSLNNDTTSAASTSITLPSHLKLEFDKMKYLPDVVKTIKKRHSISEIEGSGNTIPPFIVQKLLEKHKEFNQPQQQQQQPSASQLQQQSSFNSLSSVSSNNSSTNTPLITSQNSSSSSIKLSKIPEASNEGVSNSPSIVKQQQQQQAQIIPIVTNTNNLSNNNSTNGNSTKLTTFLPSVKGKISILIKNVDPHL